MPRTRGPYPPEFKARMVELVKAGRSPEQLAKEFEPSANAIRNWAHQAAYPIATQCRVLGVSTSGYCAWLKRGPSEREKANAELLEAIEEPRFCSVTPFVRPVLLEDACQETNFATEG